MATIYATDRQGIEHAIEANFKDSLMENICEAGLDLEASCGGSCACATCHVLIDPAWVARLDGASEDELYLLREEPTFQEGRSRLACQIALSEALDGLKVTLA